VKKTQCTCGAVDNSKSGKRSEKRKAGIMCERGGVASRRVERLVVYIFFWRRVGFCWLFLLFCSWRSAVRFGSVRFVVAAWFWSSRDSGHNGLSINPTTPLQSQWMIAHPRSVHFPLRHDKDGWMVN